MSEKIITRTLGQARKGRIDREKIDALTDEDIARAIQDDPDTAEMDSGWFRNAMLLRPVQPKEPVTIRLDADMLAWFQGQGRGYQTRINAVLRAYYEAQQAAKPKV